MDILKNFLYPNKNDILDPLSLVVKLYIYSYKPIKTKISILNNKIDFQEDNLFQSAIRTINRDTKNDLINMLLPLTFACNKYLGDKKNREKYTYLFSQIIFGLDKLNKVYESNEITQNIEQLKNIVDKFLENDEFNPETIVSNWNGISSNLKKSFYLQTDLVWTETRTEILFGFLEEIKNYGLKDDISVLISSLHSYMVYIDLLVLKIINQIHLLK